MEPIPILGTKNFKYSQDAVYFSTTTPFSHRKYFHFAIGHASLEILLHQSSCGHSYNVVTNIPSYLAKNCHVV